VHGQRACPMHDPFSHPVYETNRNSGRLHCGLNHGPEAFLHDRQTAGLTAWRRMSRGSVPGEVLHSADKTCPSGLGFHYRDFPITVGRTPLDE
jgi:hypothetical protein